MYQMIQLTEWLEISQLIIFVKKCDFGKHKKVQIKVKNKKYEKVRMQHYAVFVDKEKT